MASAFRDTLFAYTLRSVFGSRVFAYADEKALPTIWQDKLSSQTSPRDSAQSTLHGVPRHDVSSIHSGTTVAGADAPRKVDPEKGKDTLLVDWYGPTDPDVSHRSVLLVPTTCLPDMVISSESAELVEWEEGMGHVSDMSPDVHHLRRICHLYRWNPIHLC